LLFAPDNKTTGVNNLKIVKNHFAYLLKIVTSYLYRMS